MTIGWAILIVGVLYLCTKSPSFRRGAVIALAISAVIVWAAFEGNQTAGYLALPLLMLLPMH
jgi:hypothetical protein